MLEQVLQEKLVEVVKANRLLEFINGKNLIDAPLHIDEDDHFIPEFLIDSLLRRRYAESARRVLKSLESYDLVTGEKTLSISLKTGEILKPDMVLFNTVVNQIILIENKMDDLAEREGMTELLAFGNEIRNHLPFISNLDINYVLISPDFKPLLDHSVSAQLLGGHINLLCLKPMVTGDEITGLEIHFPGGWTDIGQDGLPPEALISFSMCLYRKNSGEGDFMKEVLMELDGESGKAVDVKDAVTDLATTADLVTPLTEPVVTEIEIPAGEGVPSAADNVKAEDKEEDEDNDDDERLSAEGQRAITLAADMIAYEAANFHANGFCLTWVNGLERVGGMVAAITLYVLNPFAFLPDAVEKGYTLRDNPLMKYLADRQKENEGNMFPSSMFAIADKAEAYLKRYFDVRWERMSTWKKDLEDTRFAIQRKPVLIHSYGVVGDFIKYFYFHPAVQRHWLSSAEKKQLNYNSPLVALQFVNLMAGNVLFKDGDFSPKDVFKFGRFLNLHFQAQRNGRKFMESDSVQYDAMLFWTALPLTQAIKEIFMRLGDAKDIDLEELVSPPIAIDRKGIQEGFEEDFQAFIKWFATAFLDRDDQPMYSELFRLGVQYGAYFDEYLLGLYPPDDLTALKTELASFARYVLGGIGMAFAETEGDNAPLEKQVSDLFFAGKLAELAPEGVDGYLAKVPDDVFLESFEDGFLDIVNELTGNLLHELKNYEFPATVDWQWMYEAAQDRFKEGHRNTAVVVGANGQIYLAQAGKETGLALNDSSEVFIHADIYYSGMPIMFKVKWEELLNRTFRFADLVKGEVGEELADPVSNDLQETKSSGSAETIAKDNSDAAQSAE